MIDHEPLSARLRNAVTPLRTELELDPDCSPELLEAAEHAVSAVLAIAVGLEGERMELLRMQAQIAQELDRL